MVDRYAILEETLPQSGNCFYGSRLNIDEEDVFLLFQRGELKKDHFRPLRELLQPFDLDLCLELVVDKKVSRKEFHSQMAKHYFEQGRNCKLYFVHDASHPVVNPQETVCNMVEIKPFEFGFQTATKPVSYTTLEKLAQIEPEIRKKLSEKEQQLYAALSVLSRGAPINLG